MLVLNFKCVDIFEEAINANLSPFLEFTANVGGKLFPLAFCSLRLWLLALFFPPAKFEGTILSHEKTLTKSSTNPHKQKHTQTCTFKTYNQTNKPLTDCMKSAKKSNKYKINNIQCCMKRWFYIFQCTSLD